MMAIYKMLLIISAITYHYNYCKHS
uniref:Uncharacterized protein n=1 Tax=Anguilla anguilla TaxID=7936 RepID=A0A0E9RY33_ANGAN